MNKLPENIAEGMDVFDSENDKIGTIEAVKFGDEAQAQGAGDAGRDSSLIDNLADALWPHEIPEAERAMLLAEGYAVLDADGVLAKDRYIRPDNIASVSDEGVFLNVSRQDLIKA